MGVALLLELIRMPLSWPKQVQSLDELLEGEERREERGGRGYGRRGSYGRRSFDPGRRNRGFERDRGPVPVEEGQEVDVTVESVGRRGDGIARINNFVVFIPGTNEGDKVKVRITSVRGSFATGEVVKGE